MKPAPPPSPEPTDSDELGRVKRSFSRAELSSTRLDGRPAVIKDFRGKNWILRRVIGPRLLDREQRAYDRLAGLEGFPSWTRRLHREALAVERVRGEVLARTVARQFGPILFDRLAATVERMHDHGVVHLDLHQKRNVLVTGDGHPVLIDFATSLRFGRGGRPRHLLFRRLASLDRAAVLKFKARYLPEHLTPEELRRVRRSRRLSALWISRPLNAVKKRISRARRRARAREGDRGDSA